MNPFSKPRPSGLVLCTAASIAALALQQLAFADSGTFEVTFSTVNTLHQIDRGQGSSIVGGSSVGTFIVTKGQSEPFVEAAFGESDCLPLVKKGPNSIDLESYCTFTSDADDKLFGVFRRKSGDIVAGTGGQGSLELQGGTGKYKNVTGTCPYKTNYLQTAVLTVARCQWSR